MERDQQNRQQLRKYSKTPSPSTSVKRACVTHDATDDVGCSFVISPANSPGRAQTDVGDILEDNSALLNSSLITWLDAYKVVINPYCRNP